VKSKGAKAYKVRTEWRSQGRHISYIVSNRKGFNDPETKSDLEKFITNINEADSCTIT